MKSSTLKWLRHRSRSRRPGVGPSRTVALWSALSSIAKTRNVGETLQFLNGWARYPVVDAAARVIESLPTMTLTQVLPGGVPAVPLQAVFADAADWSLNPMERIILSAIATGLHAQCVFEIGTFNGGTTRMLAELIPDGGRVVTLDLPVESFDATQRPAAFTGVDVGRAFRGTDIEKKVTQLRIDSLQFDPSRYEGMFDVVLVDGAHDYEHGFVDTQTALRLVRPGGVILWDDFEPYWAGLIHGIVDAMGTRRFGRLAGSAFGVYCAPRM